MSKVERQKGPIKADMPTMKTMKRKEIDVEDHQHDKMRRSMKTNTLHEPKTKRKK